MLYILFAPFVLQALLIFFDEGYFHLRRGLPKWERIGHPIDTLSFVACLVMILLAPFSMTTLITYILLSLVSCLLITKDEFVHKEHCPPSEQWVHAVLFVNHPIMLISLGFLWHGISPASSATLIPSIAANKSLVESFIKGQTLLTTIFMCYQIIFWNFIWTAKTNK